MPEPKEYRAKDGTVTWKVRFRWGERQCQETFDTLKEADAFCSDLRTRNAAYALKVLHQRDAPDTDKLDVIAAKFFDWKATKVRSDRTVADYRRDYAKWIGPILGDQRAGNIDETDVQAWVDGMAGQLSPKSICDRHALLHGIYDYAIAPTRRLVDRNPCIGTELPKKQKPLPKGLLPAEWEALYAALRQIDTDAADLALFLLATGWRISEASALTTFEVEDYGNRMWVNMNAVIRRNAAGQHLRVEDEGKGQASLRRVSLDPEAAEMIRRRMGTLRPGDLVFTTGVSAQNGLGGSQWHYSNFVNRYWKPAVKVANLTRKPTPHWLRHTHVAWMAMSGASLPELQSRIGHASIATTINVYGRMLTDVQPAALDAFAAMRTVGAPQPGRAITQA